MLHVNVKKAEFTRLITLLTPEGTGVRTNLGVVVKGKQYEN